MEMPKGCSLPKLNNLMPLPPTRYIDAGPGVPLANPNAAMAQGAAMGRLGESISQVGERGLQIAERLRKIDDNRKMTSLFTGMERETADFELGLMKREDTENWQDEYAEKSESWKQAAGESKLSPEGQAVFDERFAEWNSIELARSTIANSYDFHMGRRDYGAAQQVLEDAHQSGFSSAPDLEKGRMVIEKASRHDGIMDGINADARAWMADNPADKPPGDYDAAKWRQIHDYAAGIARDEDAASSDEVLNRVVTGKITTRAEIEGLTPKMTPLQRQKLFEASDRWNAEGAKARRNEPENISANVGKFYATLNDWKPDEEGQDPAGVELRMLVEELPEGHPLRDKMRDSMAARKSRIGDEVKTKADQGIKTLKDAAERGDFGMTKLPEAPNIETRAAVGDGFLKDIPKLQSLGFSESQAEDIREAATDPALGQKKFTELWKDRGQQSVNATPFDIAVSDALRQEDGEVKWKANLSPEVMDAHETASRAYGKAMIDFEKWIQLNPSADDKAIGGKLRELGSQSARVAPVSGPVKAPPGRETSMVVPKDGFKLSNYGYSSDTTPDSNSANGIGHRDNKLIAGQSAAISKSLADRLKLSHGDKLKIETTKGPFTVFYHDTVPSTDSRTGDLPETIDIYRPQDGANGWGGRVTKVSKI
jgi:hypothetical protein